MHLDTSTFCRTKLDLLSVKLKQRPAEATAASSTVGMSYHVLNAMKLSSLFLVLEGRFSREQPRPRTECSRWKVDWLRCLPRFLVIPAMRVSILKCLTLED